MKKGLIVAALILSTGILSANAFIAQRDTATVTSSLNTHEEVIPPTINDEMINQNNIKDIGTAD